jgi:hypothetical protein
MRDDAIDSEIGEMADNPRVARALKDALRQLRDGVAGPVMAEMARELLDGSIRLRAVARSSAYGRELTAGFNQFERWEAALDPEERIRLAEGTRSTLENDLAEVESRSLTR